MALHSRTHHWVFLFMLHQTPTCLLGATVTWQLMLTAAGSAWPPAGMPGVLLPDSEADHGLVMRLKPGTSTLGLSLRGTLSVE